MKRGMRFGLFVISYSFLLFFLLFWQVTWQRSISQESELSIKEELPPLPNIEIKEAPILPKSPLSTNEKCSWWYEGNPNHQPVKISAERERILKEYQGFYLGDTTQKTAYLTFDEGYENGYTDKILDVLKEEQVPAAFFITGSYLKRNPELVKRMLKEGHIVGNHTMNHYSMALLSEEKIRQEIRGVALLFQALTQEEMAPFLRPPMGEFNPFSLWVTAQEGYYSIFWSFAYRDWEVDKQKGKEYAYEKITAHHHPGMILLLHAVSRDNTEALQEVIWTFKKEGYQFLPLTSLLK